MDYITGDAISTTTLSWETERGTKAELTLVRNAELIENGWLQSSSHAIRLVINGKQESYYGTDEDPQHGFVLQARMGKAVLPVPANLIDQVKALLGEYSLHNETAAREDDEAEAAYERRHDAIERIRTTGKA